MYSLKHGPVGVAKVSKKQAHHDPHRPDKLEQTRILADNGH